MKPQERRLPYLDTCFFLSVLFSVLPFGIVPFTYFYGADILYRSEIFSAYGIVIVLFLTGALVRKQAIALSEKKQKETLERALGELQKFKLAVEHASDHIVITDPEGIILYANRAMELTTGYSCKEVLGKKAGGKELWGGRMSTKVYEKLWKTIKISHKIFRGELKNVRKNGVEYIASASIAPVVNDAREVEFFVGIERDITREKEIDKAKTDFVSLVAHQLRSPLTAVRWYVEMLVNGDYGEVQAAQKGPLKEVQKGNQRMTDLVDMFLNISRIELGTFSVFPREMSVEELMQEVLSEAEAERREKHIRIETEFPAIQKLFAIDALLFRIVIQNFLSNAIKYSKEEGIITLRFFEEKGGFVFSVTDNGIGIPESQRDRIFSKMFRAENALKTDVEGNGLGLYIVKEIVECSGGSVTFETKENEGSTFSVRYPVEGMKKKVGARALSV